MATKKKSKLNETKPRLAPSAEIPDSAAAGESKPPESAENFEHVLRRLTAERNRRAQEI